MKKLVIISIIFFTLLCHQGFADKAKYDELLKKAKNYETQKKFIYALGTYYDAMSEETSDCEEALKCYERISNQLLSGKPGFDTYNSFTLHDEWRNRLIEAEQYWTDFPPIYIKVDEKLNQDKLNYDTKTADYSFNFGFYWKEKFLELAEILSTGCEKAKSQDWKDFPKFCNYNKLDFKNGESKGYTTFNWLKDNNWPIVSILNTSDGSLQSIFEKHKIPLIHISYGNENPKDIYVNPYYTFTSVPDSYFVTHTNTSELNFSICDKKGKELLSTEKTFLMDEKAVFSNVTQDIMAIIDGDEYQINLKSFYIHYGDISTPPSYGRDIKKEKLVIKKLSEIVIPGYMFKNNFNPIPIVKLYSNQELLAEITNKSIDALYNNNLHDKTYNEYLYELLESKNIASNATVKYMKQYLINEGYIDESENLTDKAIEVENEKCRKEIYTAIEKTIYEDVVNYGKQKDNIIRCKKSELLKKWNTRILKLKKKTRETLHVLNIDETNLYNVCVNKLISDGTISDDGKYYQIIVQ